MKYLYYCNSTYQLLNILNLHWHRKHASFENIHDYCGDIIILNSFKGAENVYKLIKEKNYFNQTILIEKTHNSGRMHALYSIMDAISPSFYFRSKHNIDSDIFKNKYDVIVTPKYSVVVDELWRLNRKASLDLYEDGIGSYYLDIPFEPNSKTYRMLRNILFKPKFYDYRHLYVVEKSMYLSKDEEKVREIPNYNESYLMELKELFAQYSNNDNEDDNIYWISQFLNNNDFNHMVDGLLDNLSEYKDDIVFVQHPRMHVENKYNFKEMNSEQIWELQLLEMKNISDKLFISIHSTACFSAKMLYGFEPNILLFYKLGDNEVTHVTDEFENIVSKFKNSYKHPERVMIPKDVDEFNMYIKRYLDEKK